LVKALQNNSPGVQWKLDHFVMELEKKEKQWWIGREAYDVCLLASSSIPEIKTEQGKQLRSVYGSIRRNSAIVVVFCFEGVKSDGFGWLVPAPERRSVMACTYVDQKFSGRVSAKRQLVRLFIGGAQVTNWIGKSDLEIRNEALSEFKRIAGALAEPVFHRVFRWPKSMPEYAVGHESRIATMEELAKLEGNLFLTGNLFAGVGIPDCIQHAKKIAEEMIQNMTQ
jgi:protoporphyrinogen/coproporphyrinogen III oxidase